MTRNIGRRSEIIRTFDDGSIWSPPADCQTDNHSDADEDQRCRAFRIQNWIIQKINFKSCYNKSKV